MIDALVIGAGPAGLMAAEELAKAGRSVVIVDAKPSPARKLLMAGKSGLNITKDDLPDPFAAAYQGDFLRPILANFGPREMVAWTRALGQEVFTGSTGRIFPRAMKASPLLRAWLHRLSDQGVTLRTRWRWTGFEGDGFAFDTPDGAQVLHPRVTVLALGGASWARLGSDGAWVPWLAQKGVDITPWHPANMGFRVNWTPHMQRHFGAAIKGAVLMAGDQRERGEFVISERGIEGGGIYSISRALRDGAKLTLNLMPDAPDIAQRLARMKSSETLVNRLRKLGLSPAAIGLIMEFGRGLDSITALQSLPILLAGPRPMDEAISVGGGIAATALGPNLDLLALPRVFACGEMLDWEAPTGGYLLTACWATGAAAGKAAAKI